MFSSTLPTVREPVNLPPCISDLGEAASRRFLEFFAAQIRNQNTRKAYVHATRLFFSACPLPLAQIQPMHVAAHIERLGQQYQPATVKQHLAALRRLFAWLVTGQVMPVNPADSVRGPRYVVRKGKTPVLDNQELKSLFASFNIDSLIGLRDRALIATMFYAFARVSAVIQMQVSDFFVKNRHHWIRLHEKGGVYHEVVCHHNLNDYLHDYIVAAGLDAMPKSPLFRSTRGRSGCLTDRPMARQDVYDMVKRRLCDAGIETPGGNHLFRASGITVYMRNNGSLEKAKTIAAHASTRTTDMYNHADDEVLLDEIERIAI